MRLAFAYRHGRVARMTYRIILAALPFVFAAPALGQEEPAPVTPTSIVEDAAAEEWITIPAEDLLVMELAPDTEGKSRRVVIQLVPPPFSQPWVENIRTLAAAHWWDGTSVNRVQDNYVTQWGDVTEAKPLPSRVAAPESPYESSSLSLQLVPNMPLTYQQRPELQSPTVVAGVPVFRGLKSSEYSVFANGFPFAGTMNPHFSIVWPIHCYGYVGVGRGFAPDTGTGAELYTIIGQPQRHMDRNLAVVGRVIEGMQHLSSLPRGSGDLGFYTDDEAHLRTPILSVRLASELSEAPEYQYLNTRSDSFARYVTVRANRDDAFYTQPAGGVDICSVQVPVRQVSE